MVEPEVRVLLVEDDQDDYLIVRNLLIRAIGERCTLEWAKSYDEAVKALERSYDVCLLDYRLGARDGLDFLGEIKRSASNIPVIVLTGRGDFRVDLEAMQAGASDFLAKDEINEVLLERSIRYAIDRKRTETKLKDYAARLEGKNKELMEALDNFHGAEEELRQKNRRLKLIHDQLRYQNDELTAAHEAVKVERLRYMDLFDNAPDGYILTNEHGIIRAINHQAESLLGIGRDQAVGLSIAGFVAGEDRRPFFDQMERLKLMRGLRGWQVRLLPKQGERFHAEISATSVLPSADEGLAIRWSIRDISKRKRMEDELAKHRERLEELVGRRTAELDRAKAEAEQKALELDAALTSIADGVIIYGPDERISRINPAGESLFGYTYVRRNLSIEQRLSSVEILNHEGQELSLEELPECRAFGGEKVVGRQLWVRPKENGRARSIVISASPIKTRSGEFLGVIATFTDVTRQVELTEELRKARDELDIRVRERTAELTRTNVALAESEKRLRFLSSKLLSAQEEERKRISRDIHDSLGSSLTTIKLALETSRERLINYPDLSQELGKIVSITQETIDEARRIMTDLRPSILDDLGIGATIGWLCRQCRTVCPTICVEEDITIDENEVPGELKTVIFRIAQEALNNIRKYSRAELVNLSLCRRGDLIELAIEDNGIGCDLKAILSKKSFDKGIGLTSMKERTELFGGIFAIDSAPGVGTAIKASWPSSDLSPNQVNAVRARV